MTPGRLIGVGGRLGAGKDALADYLVERHGWVKLGMSDALNDAMLALDPWVEYYREDEPERYSEVIARYGYVEAKKRFPEVRRLLQSFGTEVGRGLFGEDIWVDIARRRIRELRETGFDIIITGIRFPNELGMIRKEHGISVWVTRPGHESTGTHASENSVDSGDFGRVILNDGTLEDLHEQARQLI